jgi:antitoxin (DNA-binding transcriptional repressor) of toxin-antitoxin stability system
MAGERRGRAVFAGRLETVIADLADVDREAAGDDIVLTVAGRPFAVIGQGRLEVLLAPVVARAATRTPDATASQRGLGWVEFAPGSVDRFALDRAEAWLRSSHRLVSGDPGD